MNGASMRGFSFGGQEHFGRARPRNATLRNAPVLKSLSNWPTMSPMHINRRQFVGWSAAGLAGTLLARPRALRAAGAARFKVGVTDWNLKQEGKVESIALPKQIGFDGLQVSLGKG